MWIIYYMTTLVWLFFLSYLNHMIHTTMFPTIHLRKSSTRNQMKYRHNFVPYGHILVPLHVTLRLFSLLICRNVLLLIHISVHFNLFLLFFWFFLWFTNFSLLYPSFLFLLNIFLSFLSTPHFSIMMQYVFQSLFSLLYQATISRIPWMLIFVRVGLKRQFKIGFLKLSYVAE